MDEEVICFKHCGSIIFCFGLPELCPLCENPLLPETLEDIPYRLPYPFVRAQQHPCSIVIKSTNGTFLQNYSCNKDLHIGITDSRGIVYEYDAKGLQKHNTEEWKQAIVVYKVTEVWRNQWDATLVRMSSKETWNADSYDESSFNCYSFVIGFLKELNYKELNEFTDKGKFCEKFIFSKIVSTNEYIRSYRSIKKNGYYFKTAQDDNSSD